MTENLCEFAAMRAVVHWEHEGPICDNQAIAHVADYHLCCQHVFAMRAVMEITKHAQVPENGQSLVLKIRRDLGQENQDEQDDGQWRPESNE